MATDQYLLGIDYGTESCRVAIFDLRGTPIYFAATPYQTTHPRAGWAEQSPKEWWEALQASCRKALTGSGIAPAQIAGISYDATTMTVVAMNAKGEELRPAIMWMDVRATKQAAKAETSDSWARLYNGDGTAPATAEWYPFKAAWLRENEPETYNNAVHLVDAPDWLTYKLTGEWTTNINSAALRMYYNRDKGGWPVDFYEHIGCGDVFDKIPENVVDLGKPVGGLSTVAAQLLGLLPGIPVAQGPADAWAGQIGLGVVKPGKMALITGSSHVFTGQTDKPIHGKGFFGAYTDGVAPGQYTVEGGQVSTGSVMKWFKDNFARDVVSAADSLGLHVYDIMNDRSKDIPIGCDGLIINEYFQGNRTPYTDSKARGMIWGLSLHHGPAHVYKAIQEGICYGNAHNLKAMEDAGMQVNEVVACGGMTKSHDLMQMHADVMNKPVTLTEVGDAVALGSAMLAAMGAGIYSSLEEAADNMVHDLETIEPDQARHEEYSYYRDKYMAAWPQMRDLTHDLVDHEAAK
ncbi:FGGY-family carbohydrate kinase [Nigerium massiliense]|uniref:FGGY-family carbohydrate kinase n=1 Tax=Nigerium massiliense TaxID=1522317 RepID=UPI00058FC3F6|nr:FGGY-family carbohydrate kinase [Nigerium massiliense]